MPFDGRTLHNARAIDALDTVLAVLGREGRWCKGALHTEDGRRCLMAALRGAKAVDALEPILLSAIQEVTGRTVWRIEHFNDRPATTHADVLDVLHLARQWLLAGAAA